MSIGLDNFSLLKEDDENYHIGHPNGRHLIVSKKGLSPEAHKAIKKYADGGVVKGADPKFVKGFEQSIKGEQPTPTPSPTPASPQAYAEGGDVQQPNNFDPQAGLLAAAQPSAAPAPQPQAPPAVPAAPAPEEANPLETKGNEEDALLKKEAKAEGEKGKALSTEGKEETKALKGANEQLEAMPTPEDIAANYAQKDQQLMQAFQSSRIDPNRYYANQDLGSKISAGIGLILSGFGSGASHQKNLAAEMIENSINRDIEAQKSEQNKNLTLWKMNREALHSDQEANLATQNQLLTGVEYQVKQAAANAKSPIAQANADQAVNLIEQKRIENRLQLGLLGAQGQGGMSKLDPAQLVPVLIKDPARQKEVLKEIQDAQNAQSIKKDLLGLFHQASGDVKNPVSLAVTPASLSRIRALALPLIHDKEGRVNEFEQKTLKALEPAIYDTPERLKAKEQGWVDFINQKASAPAAKAAGIDLQKFSSTSQKPEAGLDPQKQQYLQWAKANPQDPRAALVLKKLGVQ